MSVVMVAFVVINIIIQCIRLAGWIDDSEMVPAPRRSK